MSRQKPDQRYIVAAVYVASMLMNTLDSTIVIVALATLGREFNVPAVQTEAVVVAYLVSLAVFIPASGWLGDRFGTKRIFLIALAIFATASMLCGLSRSLEQLVAFRVLQGAGGGLMTPVGMAMLYRTFPPAERVAVGRILMFATILGPALGPIIGGVLIERLSWHWAFFVNVPVALVAFLVGLFFLHEHREPEPGRFDLPGFVLGGAGLGAAMYALSEGPAHGWTSPDILGPGAVGLALIVAFVARELRVAAPMVDLRLLGNRLFRSTLVVSFFGSAGFIGVLFLIPLFLQEVQGASPLESGLTTFPEALGVVTSTQIVARLYPRYGPRRLMCGGLVGLSVAIVALATIGLSSSNPWVIRVLMFFVGFCMAYVFLPNQAASLATISRAQTGRATTLTNVQRQVGGALGVAVLSSVVAAASAFIDGPTDPAPYRYALYFAAAFALVGAISALQVPDEEAAETMRPRAPREEPVLVEAG
ncbi:MAG: DHA2 family efflux MFS transporter permease subunit [Thermomicrobiales bacterium]|nr:DHA2 family efflux MFS transporter permease subunit [Thermomicrobiales bacterium]